MSSLRYLSSAESMEATDVLNPGLNYGIVVDCGSSGSRVFVYYWPPHNGNPHTLLDIRQMRDHDRRPVVKKIKPGEEVQTCSLCWDTFLFMSSPPLSVFLVKLVPSYFCQKLAFKATLHLSVTNSRRCSLWKREEESVAMVTHKRKRCHMLWVIELFGVNVCFVATAPSAEGNVLRSCDD